MRMTEKHRLSRLHARQRAELRERQRAERQAVKHRSSQNRPYGPAPGRPDSGQPPEPGKPPDDRYLGGQVHDFHRPFLSPPPRGHRRKGLLTFVFSAVVFIIIAVTMLIMSGIAYLLTSKGILTDIHLQTPNILFPILIFAISSIIVGTIVATAFSHFPLRPLHRLISGMNLLADGKFDTRIKMGGYKVGQDIEQSFNTLASELQNTELLRMDFINNFPHEFKTPIVSIRGFAKLLLRDDLSPAQRQEYLEIIIEESGRLSVMATNVLDLTKLENQSILTNTSVFNLSEQIRNSLLILERAWTSKKLEINAEFDEHYINANEEMLKQVWINLLHNAIKFSAAGGEVDISIADKQDSLAVTITNGGEVLDAEACKRAFDKFWQGDSSHTAEGTGIGLSIAKRIVDLHRGKIYASAAEGLTIFTVELPKSSI